MSLYDNAVWTEKLNLKKRKRKNKQIKSTKTKTFSSSKLLKKDSLKKVSSCLRVL